MNQGKIFEIGDRRVTAAPYQAGTVRLSIGVPEWNGSPNVVSAILTAHAAQEIAEFLQLLALEAGAPLAVPLDELPKPAPLAVPLDELPKPAETSVTVPTTSEHGESASATKETDMSAPGSSTVQPTGSL